jgi:membrane protease YdiL (CAAX protease family)
MSQPSTANGTALASLPPRSGRLASASTLVICVALAASGLLGQAALVAGALLVALALGIGLWSRSAATAHLAAVVLFSGLAYELLGRWPLPVLLTLAAYAVALFASPKVRQGAPWLRRGRFDRKALAIMGLFIAGEAVALIIWRYTTSADLGRFKTLIPDVPLWMIPFGLAGFAMLNAAYEELLWRGLMQHALEAATRSRWHAWWLQGLGFGLWHFEGFPSGWVGSGLATVFALMMGYLRLRSAGMLAPFIGHLCADITIFTLVAIMVLG